MVQDCEPPHVGLGVIFDQVPTNCVIDMSALRAWCRRNPSYFLDNRYDLDAMGVHKGIKHRDKPSIRLACLRGGWCSHLCRPEQQEKLRLTAG